MSTNYEMSEFESILEAQRIIYTALLPLDKRLRDRILRHVQDALNDNRVPLRVPVRARCVQPGKLPEVFDERI